MHFAKWPKVAEPNRWKNKASTIEKKREKSGSSRPCPCSLGQDIFTFIYTSMQNSHWDNFMLICIKSIPFWRQFEDWNTNFELSTWDPTSGSLGQNGQTGSDRNQHWDLTPNFIHSPFFFSIQHWKKIVCKGMSQNWYPYNKETHEPEVLI